MQILYEAASGGPHKAGDRKESGQSTPWAKKSRSGHSWKVENGQGLVIGKEYPASSKQSKQSEQRISKTRSFSRLSYVSDDFDVFEDFLKARAK